MKCIICNNYSTLQSDLRDDRYGYRGNFELYCCNACGHKFLNARFSQRELTKLYTDYYPRSTLKLELYEPVKEVKGFLSWLNGERRSAYCWVPKNVRVLDIGCGFGGTLGYHKARGCDVYGVEADENIKRVAKKFGFRVHFGLFDPNNYEPGFFDYVTLDQVIEHVTDPLSTMRGIANVLKPGGIAILSTPNASGWGARLFGRLWINWHAPYHLQHFNLKSMRLTAEEAGLKLEKAKTVTSSEWLFYQWLHLVTFPHEGQPSAFWSPKGHPTFLQKFCMKLLSLIHKTKINHIITRFFDSIGFGDNYLIILRKQ